MFMKELEHLNRQVWTVAIEDVYLGTMCVKFNFVVQVFDIGWVPVDVISECNHIERNRKGQL